MKTIKLVFTTLICFVGFVLSAQNIDLNQKLPINSPRSLEVVPKINTDVWTTAVSDKPQNKLVRFIILYSGE